MNIIEALEDERLFKPFLADAGQGSWENWKTALRCLYGLQVGTGEGVHGLIETATGLQVEALSRKGYDQALFLTGRRSGKSRVAAIVGAFSAIHPSNLERLSAGETGLVALLAPTRRQAKIVRGYVEGIFDSTPMLKEFVLRADREGLLLKNGVRIEILTGDWRSVRGFTLLAAVVDEICFFGLDEESKVRSDTELVRALLPGLATSGGKLIAISSPYSKKGWSWRTYRRNFGKAGGSALVWNCPSRTMNPGLSQAVVDAAMADDPASARAEYLGQFREDVAEFLPRSLIEGLVVEGRKELQPRANTSYAAFADLSGGRHDDAALAIAHKGTGGKVVLDMAKRWKAPHNPADVIVQMAKDIKLYGLTKVTGDNYSAEFCVGAFRHEDIVYTKSDKARSKLYQELLPRLCSGQVELLDNDLLVDQLAGLERRTRSGGQDIIDHAPGAHDDLANAGAGAIIFANKTQRRKGVLW